MGEVVQDEALAEFLPGFAVEDQCFVEVGERRYVVLSSGTQDSELE